MIVDPSALVAIVLREPDHERLLHALTTTEFRPGIGAPSVAELGLVLAARMNADSRALITGMLDQFGIDVVEFTENHWREAIGASGDSAVVGTEPG